MDTAPDIIVKQNSLDNSRKILSVRERESLNNELQIRQGMMGANDSSYGLGQGNHVIPPGMAIDKQRISSRAKEIAKVLQEGTPEPLNQREKDLAAKRIKELEDKFAKEDVLETVAELRVMRRDSRDWQTAMDKAKRRPNHEMDIAEWKNLNRRLNPDDDEADNLNRLRKSK